MNTRKCENTDLHHMAAVALVGSVMCIDDVLMCIDGVLMCIDGVLMTCVKIEKWISLNGYLKSSC